VPANARKFGCYGDEQAKRKQGFESDEEPALISGGALAA
jgi:hypothetical protein